MENRQFVQQELEYVHVEDELVPVGTQYADIYAVADVALRFALAETCYEAFFRVEHS